MSLSYSAADIADMLLNSPSSTDGIAAKISKDWEPVKEGALLKACLDDALNSYTCTIAGEIAFDNSRKLLALIVEVELRIRSKIND